jgi:hypothetical protein
VITDPDPRWFPLINEFARDTPWLHPLMIGYADHGIVAFAALLLAGWWIARRSSDRNVLAGLILGTAIGGAGFGAARPGPARVLTPEPNRVAWRGPC